MGLIFGKITVETPKYSVLAEGQDYQVREYEPNLVAEVTYEPSLTRGGKNGGFMVLANYIGALGKANNVKAEAGGGEQTGDDSEKIAMTAPVITQETAQAGDSEKIAMTASVITQETEKAGDSEKIATTAPVSTQETEKAGDSEKIATTAPVMTQETAKADDSEKIAMTAPVITQESTDSGEKSRKKMMTMQFVLPSKYRMENVPRPTDPRVVVKEVPARKYGVVKFSGIADDKIVRKKVVVLTKALQEGGYKIIGEHLLGQFNPPWTIPHLRTNEVMLPLE